MSRHCAFALALLGCRTAELELTNNTDQAFIEAYYGYGHICGRDYLANGPVEPGDTVVWSVEEGGAKVYPALEIRGADGGWICAETAESDVDDNGKYELVYDKLSYDDEVATAADKCACFTLD